MARSLVIVESPAKAKTINKYLGRNYNVKASYGHVMDLPKKTIGILLPGEQNGKKKSKRKSKAKGKAAGKEAAKPMVVTAENIFEPTYEVIPSKLKVIGDLQRAAQNADAIYLAGDPDREGEAICAHLAEILSKPRKYTKVVAEAVAEADADKRKRGQIRSRRQAGEETGERGPLRSSEDLSRDVQRNHAESDPRRIRASLAGKRKSGRRAASPPRPRSPRRLQSFASPLGQSPPRPFRRSRPDRRAAPRSSSASTKSAPSFPRNTGRCTPSSAPASRRPSKPSSIKYNGERHRNSRRSRGATRSRSRRSRHLASRKRRAEGKAPLRSASLHHFEASAGWLQSPALHREAHHDARAAPLRRRRARREKAPSR